MLIITIEGDEYYDEESKEFKYSHQPITLTLEHSLVSLSKWESKFRKPFLGKETKTTDEVREYVRDMVVDADGSLDCVENLKDTHILEINKYLDSPQSATTFYNLDKKPRGKPEVITSELIYYWMVALTIPFECETWHLNRLFNLIQICNIKNSKPTKMSKREIAQRNSQLNAQRRSQLGTSG